MIMPEEAIIKVSTRHGLSMNRQYCIRDKPYDLSFAYRFCVLVNFDPQHIVCQKNSLKILNSDFEFGSDFLMPNPEFLLDSFQNRSFFQ